MTLTAPTPTLENLVAEGEVRYSSGDTSGAFEIFGRAALAGDATAWMWLSTCHAEGAGTPISRLDALACLRQAAELGQPQAQSNLGVMLVGAQDKSGDPVQDVEAGLGWLRRAAAQRDVGACFNLATVLSRDKEVAPNWREAAASYQVAAEAGHFPSQMRLGFCYRNGFGVAKDRVQAFLWTALAARHGVGTALEQLEKIVFEMSARERADGEDLLRQHSKEAGPVLGAVPFRVVTS